MSQRYGSRLLERLPEVSGVLGVDWSGGLEKAVSVLGRGGRISAVGPPGIVFNERAFDTWGGGTLMVRVSEGCDRRCRFCTIPAIKGGFVSRTPDDIKGEIETLSVGREIEVVLLAQDMTSYGKDLPGKTGLPSLIRDVSELDCVRWVRPLYLQPEGVTEELIVEMTGNRGSEVLRRMGRRGSESQYRDLISSIRRRSPEASLRTTVMVGYPGETEKEFLEMVEFIEDIRFDWLGAFIFSPEEGTPAAELNCAVPRDVAVSRYNTLLSVQDSVEESGLARNLGRDLEMVVDSRDEIEGYDLLGRSYREAPLVDGVIHIRLRKGGRDNVNVGSFVDAKIVGREGLDLVAEV